MLFDVLPPLGVPRLGLAQDHIRMRQLIHQNDGRTARQRGIEIQLRPRDAPI
jgi:hypothetical protein